MLNIGTGEMLLICVVALLILGPKRLPEMARTLGRFWRNFSRQANSIRGMVEREFLRMDLEENNKAALEAMSDAQPQATPPHPKPPGPESAETTPYGFDEPPVVAPSLPLEEAGPGGAMPFPSALLFEDDTPTDPNMAVPSNAPLFSLTEGPTETPLGEEASKKEGSQV
ncbi:MAG: Sec-independent protein translocase protein TatB [Cystobacterineae bacterium]|nr:Sec-independent protein translocase protein TatB [Cystobacterineae bacterium]